MSIETFQFWESLGKLCQIGKFWNLPWIEYHGNINFSNGIFEFSDSIIRTNISALHQNSEKLWSMSLCSRDLLRWKGQKRLWSRTFWRSLNCSARETNSAQKPSCWETPLWKLISILFEAVADIFQPGIFTALNLEPDNGFPLGRYVSHVILKAALKMKKANRVWLWCQVLDLLKFRC